MTEQPILPPEENPFFGALGITPSFDDVSEPPPIDRELLRRYYRGELAQESIQEVHRLVGRYRAWFAALAEIVGQRGRDED